MNDNVFSDSWYRVSKLKVSLLHSVSIQKQYYRDKLWYVIQEPYANKYFKITFEAYKFLSHLKIEKTIEEVWEEYLSQNIEDAPTQNDIIELLSSLHTNNLLYFETNPDNKFIFERNNEKKLQEVKGKLFSFLYFKFPLYNPNKLLDKSLWLIRNIFTPFGFFIWLIVLYLGAEEAISNYTTIYGQAQGMLAPSNLFLLYISLALLKLLHEISHAAMTKKYGGSVNTMGVMFLILTPLPYMDASHSWFFANKYKRMLVGFAGIMSDLFFASIAAIVWANTGDGIVHSICFNIMIIGSISSLLFNGNPLLKFDAYFILSDWLEIPNFFNKSQEQVFYLFEKYIFRVQHISSHADNTNEAIWLVAYAVLSYLYRFLVALGVIVYVADQFFILGVIMAILSIIIWVVLPLKNFLIYLFNSHKLYRTRYLAFFISFGCFSIILYLVAFIPFPHLLKAPGIIESQESIKVYAKTEGNLQKILFKNGDFVKEGDEIAIIDNYELMLDIQDIYLSLNQISTLRQKFIAENSDLSSLNEKEVVLRNKLSFLKNKEKNLKVIADTSGIFVLNDFSYLEGAWIKRQTQIGTITKKTNLKFSAVVSQEQAFLLFELKKIKNANIKLYGQSEQKLNVINLKVNPYGKNELPSAALGWFGGGEISVSSEETNGKKTTEGFFEVSGDIVKDEKNEHILKDGRSGILRIELEPQCISTQVYQYIRQMMQKRYKL
jgi:putative peptide zinc metalloprotease protein